MLTVDEYEQICSRQRDSLAYGAGPRERLCDHATVLFILAERLSQVVVEQRAHLGLSAGLGQASAALDRATLMAAWWRECSESASETELSERLLLANQHIDNAIQSLRSRCDTRSFA